MLLHLKNKFFARNDAFVCRLYIEKQIGLWNSCLFDSTPWGRELIKCTELTLVKTALEKKRVAKLFNSQSLVSKLQQNDFREFNSLINSPENPYD